jgi:hypothetical protein
LELLPKYLGDKGYKGLTHVVGYLVNGTKEIQMRINVTKGGSTANRTTLAAENWTKSELRWPPSLRDWVRKEEKTRRQEMEEEQEYLKNLSPNQPMLRTMSEEEIFERKLQRTNPSVNKAHDKVQECFAAYWTAKANIEQAAKEYKAVYKKALQNS